MNSWAWWRTPVALVTFLVSLTKYLENAGKDDSDTCPSWQQEAAWWLKCKALVRLHP